MTIGRRAVLALPVAWASVAASASASRSIRVGTRVNGALRWELAVMRAHGFDADAGVRVEIVDLATRPEGEIALAAGRVDIGRSDWLWVSRQRAAGADWSFVPTSCALGAVMGPKDSPLRGLPDLPGQRLGFAGSAGGKSWVFLRAYARRQLGLDLADRMQVSFGTPGMLSDQLAAGRLDAALMFWIDAAKARAAGMPVIIGMAEVTRGLGVPPGVPFTGCVFSEAWARDNETALHAFLVALRRARALLVADDAEWDRIAPAVGAGGGERALMMAAYRAGVPDVWGEPERLACDQLVKVLAETGGRSLVGGKARISPGAFWPVSWSDHP